MGYILTHPQRWRNKRKPSIEEQEQLSRLFDLPRRWHEHANRRLHRLRSQLGYDHANLQSSEEWLEAFEQTLLKNQWWSERRGILTLNAFNPRRSGLVLLALFFFTQHARVQFLNPMQIRKLPDAGFPFEEINGNHHNLDHSLLQMICGLCGYRDDTPRTDSGWFSRWVPGAVLRYLKPVPYVSPYTVMRWVRAAEEAGGLAPRGTQRLLMTWKTTRASAWKRLRDRSLRYLPEGWVKTWQRSRTLFLLIGAIYIYGAYYSVRCVLRLLHF